MKKHQTKKKKREKKAKITTGSRNDMAVAKPAHGDTPVNIT
jgi:hypothetical protein